MNTFAQHSAQPSPVQLARLRALVARRFAPPMQKFARGGVVGNPFQLGGQSAQGGLGAMQAPGLSGSPALLDPTLLSGGPNAQGGGMFLTDSNPILTPQINPSQGGPLPPLIDPTPINPLPGGDGTGAKPGTGPAYLGPPVHVGDPGASNFAPSGQRAQVIADMANQDPNLGPTTVGSQPWLMQQKFGGGPPIGGFSRGGMIPFNSKSRMARSPRFPGPVAAYKSRLG